MRKFLMIEKTQIEGTVPDNITEDEIEDYLEDSDSWPTRHQDAEVLERSFILGERIESPAEIRERDNRIAYLEAFMESLGYYEVNQIMYFESLGDVDNGFIAGVKVDFAGETHSVDFIVNGKLIKPKYSINVDSRRAICIREILKQRMDDYIEAWTEWKGLVGIKE